MLELYCNEYPTDAAYGDNEIEKTYGHFEGFAEYCAMWREGIKKIILQSGCSVACTHHANAWALFTSQKKMDAPVKVGDVLIYGMYHRDFFLKGGLLHTMKAGLHNDR